MGKGGEVARPIPAVTRLDGGATRRRHPEMHASLEERKRTTRFCTSTRVQLSTDLPTTAARRARERAGRAAPPTDADVRTRREMRPERTPFVQQHLHGVHRVVVDESASVNDARMAHLSVALAAANPRCSSGGADDAPLHLEFGVRDGRSLTHLARLRNSSVWHGFDSFAGLPQEDSPTRRDNGSKLLRAGWGRGRYTTRGRRPVVPPNAVLHGGWFTETLPRFLSTHAGVVSFAHLDADLYSSTAHVLWHLGRRCRLCAGTVLSFDELFGSAAVEAHEYRALTHAAACFGFRYRFLSYMAHGRSAFGRCAVLITDVAEARAQARDGRGRGACVVGGRRAAGGVASESPAGCFDL